MQAFENLPVEIQFKIMSFTPHPLALCIKRHYTDRYYEALNLVSMDWHIPDTSLCELGECQDCEDECCYLEEEAEDIYCSKAFMDWNEQLEGVVSRARKGGYLDEWNLFQ